MLYERLRRPPTPRSVPESLPVLFFGDPFSAEVATVGLNPSDQEYLRRDGSLLEGRAQRFATLRSLGAVDRTALTDEHCAQAIEWMLGYYRPDRPVYGWFRGLARVIEGFGASFAAGTAVHLDLVQEATSPTWSALPGNEREALLKHDLPFLEWELRTFPLQAIICTGKTVSVHVRRMLGVEIAEHGALARIKWWVGTAEVGGRALALGGWNFPLARPTGLGAAGEHELGHLLRERLAAVAG
jgi:hypothetical protein